MKNLPRSFRDTHRHVAWEDFAGMRDVLIHHYFGVDLGLVWDAVKKDLPKLKEEIGEIMRSDELDR